MSTLSTCWRGNLYAEGVMICYQSSVAYILAGEYSAASKHNAYALSQGCATLMAVYLQWRHAQ
jgi:hypothetical protein